MPDMSTIFKEDQIIEFFQKILKNKELSKQNIPSTHPFSKQFPNQYYLCTVVEFLIKYQILHKEDQHIKEFAEELENRLMKSSDYKTFLLEANRLLATSIQTKLKLTDHLTIENKKKILEYAYQNYIVDGFYFYSIPSKEIDQVKKEGIYPSQDCPFVEEMCKVDKIFKKYHLSNIFGIDPKKLAKDYFELTDSPSLSFFYSLLTPSYFSNFLIRASEVVESKEIGYDRKNYDVCSNNVELLCNQTNVTKDEKEYIMNYFNQQWNALDASQLFPTIVFISRKAIGRNHLDDYEKILDLCEQQDIIYSLSKMMDSRHQSDPRYSKLLPKDFLVVTFPSYEEILHFEKKVEVQKEEPTVMEETSPALPNNHGHADVIALLGLFFIAVGCAWFWISLYFKIK